MNLYLSWSHTTNKKDFTSHMHCFRSLVLTWSSSPRCFFEAWHPTCCVRHYQDTHVDLSSTGCRLCSSAPGRIRPRVLESTRGQHEIRRVCQIMVHSGAKSCGCGSGVPRSFELSVLLVKSLRFSKYVCQVDLISLRPGRSRPTSSRILLYHFSSLSLRGESNYHLYSSLLF